MKSILISGVSGFVGSNLEEYLYPNYKISGISRNNNSLNNRISYKELTIDVLNKSNAFIHLAGKAHDLKNTTEEKEYFDINTELTKQIFDKFIESNCEVFIYMSSVKAAADKVDEILKEGYLPNPITPYGRSKLAAEQYILSKKKASNKRVYILRPCMIHGPNNKGNLNLLYKLVSRGVPYPLGCYDNKRSFVSIDNLCYVIDQLIKNKNINSGIYNISDDNSISTNGIIDVIGVVLGNNKGKVLNIPKPIINLIAKIGNYIPIFLNEERLDKLTENFTVSNTKIKKAININELPTTLKSGLEKTIKSF